jgi:hypothetical protein
VDILESDEEQRARTTKRIIFIILFVALVGGLIWAWSLIAPLPQITECQKIGWTAGEMINGRAVCFKDCSSNVVSSCRTRRFLR